MVPVPSTRTRPCATGGIYKIVVNVYDLVLHFHSHIHCHPHTRACIYHEIILKQLTLVSVPKLKVNSGALIGRKHICGTVLFACANGAAPTL